MITKTEMNSTLAIESLIAPITLREFFDGFWGKQLLRLQRQSPDFYHDIVGLEDIDSYFESQTLHPSFLRVVRSSKDVPEQNWTRVEKRANTDLYRVVDNTQLFSLLND